MLKESRKRDSTMKGIEYDTSKIGFNSVLKNWQLKSMQVVWSIPEGVNSRTVYQEVNRMLQTDTISRASVINFLEDVRKMSVLRGEEKSGKGGFHWVYYPGMGEEGFRRFIVEKLIGCLMESFPAETREVIKNQIK
jgi:hypothetical protein